MNSNQLSAYARLLVHYCCRIKPNDNVLIRSTYLAEPLVLACQKEVLLAGGNCEFDISINHDQFQRYSLSSKEQLTTAPPLYRHAISTMDVIISIRAPFDIYELNNISSERLLWAQTAMKPIKKQMMRRGSNGDLRWVLCNYPTESLAKAAKMSLADYSRFIVNGCFLQHENPQQQWEALSEFQEKWVNVLNQGTTIRFISDNTDISFNIGDRRWINSDGKRNMPSGEIFTSPVETSGNGHIHFDVPSLMFGRVINGLTLTLKKGKVIDWDSPILDDVFLIEGANRIGEIAIATNPHITTPTLNTLFDEKIGGSIHMAIGASYPETGGKNKSSLHHDFISMFKTNASIQLDGQTIYKNGAFLS
jgi:aminopeptidase